MSKEVELTEEETTELFGNKEIRWYQIATRNAVIDAFRRGIRRVLIGSPTGTGKTIISAITLNSPELHEVLGIEDRPLRVVFLAHLSRLLTQAERTFADGMNVELRLQTPFTTVPEEDIDWCDLIVMDEAHHEAMMSVQYQLDTMTRVPILGMTATPERADGMMIKFEEIINPLSREQAVQEGWLAETSIWSIIDLSSRDKTGIVKDVLSNYGDIMGPTIVFMRTRREAQAIYEHIQSLNYSCEVLLTQNDREVNRILDDMAAGKIQFVINCAKIGEGVDVPICTTVLLGRQIASYPLLNQIIGRAARPDSDCQVFELINPLAGSNLDTTVVVGTPKQHLLCELKTTGNLVSGFDNHNAEFKEREFDYQGFVTGMVSGVSMSH